MPIYVLKKALQLVITLVKAVEMTMSRTVIYRSNVLLYGILVVRVQKPGFPEHQEVQWRSNTVSTPTGRFLPIPAGSSTSKSINICLLVAESATIARSVSSGQQTLWKISRRPRRKEYYAVHQHRRGQHLAREVFAFIGEANRAYPPSAILFQCVRGGQ